MVSGIKVCHFLQFIKSPDFEAVVNVVCAQPKKYGTDFDATMSYLSHMVMKKSLIVQLCRIAKIGSPPVRFKVAAFIWKVECKKLPKAVLNSMTKEQQMQVCKLYEQQGIKPAMKQTSADVGIAALEAMLGITS